MRIYVAGPIFGKPDRNEKAFREMADKVQYQLRATALVPHDIAPWEHPNQPCPAGRRSEGATHNEACYLRSDIANMLTCDGIALLDDWQTSLGGRTELTVANATQMSVYVAWNDLLRKIS